MFAVTSIQAVTIHLFVGCTLTVVVGWLASRCLRAAADQLMIWRAATVVMALLVTLEMTGMNSGLAGFVDGYRTAGPQAGDAVAAAPSLPLVPLPEADTDAGNNVMAAMDAIDEPLQPLSTEPNLSVEETLPEPAGQVAAQDASQPHVQPHLQPALQTLSQAGLQDSRPEPASADSEDVADAVAWRGPTLEPTKLEVPLESDVARLTATSQPMPAADRVAKVGENLPERPVEGWLPAAIEFTSGMFSETSWAYVWLLMAGLCMLPMAVTVLQTWRMRRQCWPADPALTRQLNVVSAALGINWSVDIFEHPRIVAPIAIGIARPAIVVPANFTADYSDSQRQSILAHELAHLAARDNAWLLLSWLQVAVLWWCPSVWFARRQLQTCMELVADEASSRLPDGARNLADSLLIVGRLLNSSSAVATLGMAGRGSRSSLATRVRRLLQMSGGNAIHARSGRKLRIGILFVFLLVSVLPGVVVRAEQPLENGATGMRLLERSWQRSVLAGVAAVLMGPVMTPSAQAAEEIEVEIRRDDEGRLRREVRVRDRRERRDEETEERRELEVIPGRRTIERELRVDRDARPYVVWNEIREGRIAREQAEEMRKLEAELGQKMQQQLRQREQQFRQREQQFRQREQQRREVRQMQIASDDLRPLPGRPGINVRETIPRDRSRQQHIRIAIENLHAAGLPEYAERLRVEMERASREQREQRGRDYPENRSSPEQVRHREEMEMVRREMDEMRSQLHDMRMMMGELVHRLSGASERDHERFGHDVHVEHEVEIDEDHQHHEQHDGEHEHHDGEHEHHDDDHEHHDDEHEHHDDDHDFDLDADQDVDEVEDIFQ